MKRIGYEIAGAGTTQRERSTRAIGETRISTDKRSGITSDPNRDDDPEYIVRLVGQVIRVSLETVSIVNALPAYSSGET